MTLDIFEPVSIFLSELLKCMCPPDSFQVQLILPLGYSGGIYNLLVIDRQTDGDRETERDKKRVRQK